MRLLKLDSTSNYHSSVLVVTDIPDAQFNILWKKYIRWVYRGNCNRAKLSKDGCKPKDYSDESSRSLHKFVDYCIMKKYNISFAKEETLCIR